MRKKNPSLPEIYQTISVNKIKGFWRKFFLFSGPGYLIAVGYMDPGNWATDLEGGAKFGYTLLSVILISNIMAIFLQSLSLKLGVATGRDLAQNCRDRYKPKVNFVLWILCEIAIIACDLAEIVGSAIALQLLFGIPLFYGAIITVLDVFLILYLQNKSFRYIETFVISLIFFISSVFALELFFAEPSFTGILNGFIPSTEILKNPAMLYIAVGILGATVMPHNLYLHSSIILSRKWNPNKSDEKEAVRYATADSSIALTFALFVNAAILILAAAAFHNTEHSGITEIQDAYKLLAPVLGVSFASTIFALALLASGQNSTLTSTLAGQIVLEGFMEIRLPPWLRRIITRSIAIIPVLVILALYGNNSITELLIFSQVVLSMQLPFAVIPLVAMTSDTKLMGNLVNGIKTKIFAWTIAVVISGLNIFLIYQTFL